jgi:DNA topoisomerase-1
MARSASLATEDRGLVLDPIEAARRVGLRYVSDRKPGISRHRRGKGFHYRGPDGAPVRDRGVLLRIRRLAIPPAWSEVWICSFEGGHIQATGRDARGRKQYRYHPRFRAVRDETKYEKLFEFVAALPKIRAKCERDLSLPGLPRDKVLAAVVRLLEQTLIRVGNEEYSRSNQSFGLTTLRDRHARIRGSEVLFRFRGKSGKEHNIRLNDPRLAKIVKRCRDLPGDELFQYVDEADAQHVVDSADVNAYLRAITGDEFSAKDFRTWAGTLFTALTLHELGVEQSERAGKRRIKEAIERAAERLGNTPAICRKCYVHPAVFEAYLAGRVVPRVAGSIKRRSTGLDADERAVVLFLRRQLESAKQDAPRGTLTQLLRKSVRDAKQSVRRA